MNFSGWQHCMHCHTTWLEKISVSTATPLGEEGLVFSRHIPLCLFPLLILFCPLPIINYTNDYNNFWVLWILLANHRCQEWPWWLLTRTTNPMAIMQWPRLGCAESVYHMWGTLSLRDCNYFKCLKHFCPTIALKQCIVLLSCSENKSALCFWELLFLRLLASQISLKRRV